MYKRQGIYNGDIGYIYYIDKEKKEIFVIFDSLKIVTYKYDELDELDHSFCTTIHKSQGSEFPIVEMCIRDSLYILLQYYQKLYF